MNISRKLRNELNELSVKVYGTASKWQKILNRQYVYDGQGVDEVATKRSQAAAKKLKEAGVESENVEANLTLELKYPKFRQYTPEELKVAMKQALDAQEYSRLSPEEGAKKAALQYLNKELPIELVLLVKEEDKVEFDNMMNDVSSELSEPLKKITASSYVKYVYNFPGTVFIQALLDEVRRNS